LRNNIVHVHWRGAARHDYGAGTTDSVSEALQVMRTRVFGRTPEGDDVTEVVIAGGGLSVAILTYGAVVRDLRLAGIGHPLVLGFDTFAPYLDRSPYFGAVVGRYANRIAGGRLSLDGRQYQLTLNERGKTHLHGGARGFGRRNWRLVSYDDASVVLALSSADGEEGYPGAVEVTLKYTVDTDGVLRMDVEAVTDAPTVVNLAQHSYFNLDDSADILDHRVQILAEAYTPADSDLIPTGEILSVAGTDMDFRSERPIRRMRGDARVVYDTNFVVERQKSGVLRKHARLVSPGNGLSLIVSSTEPGVQFYDGSWVDVAVPGIGGRRYGVNAGCCFEPQFFPDSPNQPGFPSAVLRPGETYRQTTTFAFART
jgi:aldose 1-epimerase